MKENVKMVALVIVALVAVGWLKQMLWPCDDGEVVHEERVETVVLRDTVRDTINVEMPREVWRTVVRHDTVRVAAADTVAAADSVLAVLPMEQKEYRGEEYDAWVSGYAARLDSIHVYGKRIEEVRDVVVTKVKKTRWGVGVQIGVGVTPQHAAQPYLGVGLQYNILGW